MGIYPAAIPASDSRVRGEIYRMFDSAVVLDALDEIEGFHPDRHGESPFTAQRQEIDPSFKARLAVDFEVDNVRAGVLGRIEWR